MNKINLSSILGFLKPAVFYLAIVFIALGMSFFLPIYSPFTLVKSAWFQVLGAIFLLISLIPFWRSFKPKRIMINKEFLVTLIPWAIFLVSLLFLNIYSLNPSQSFFGSYDRQLGFLFYFTLATWFALIVHYFSFFNKSQAEAFFSWQKGIFRSVLVMSVSATLVAIYACLQFLGYDFFLWQEGQLLSRSISSLGQPNFLGSFLLFGLSITAYLFYLNKRIFYRLLIAITLVIQLFALLSTGSRAAWLALIFTVFFYLIIFLWHKWRYRALIISSVVAIFLFFLLMIISPSRIQGLFNWQQGSLGLRSYFYQAAPTLIADNLWFGTGLENGGEAIVRSYSPDWAIFMKINGSSDKFHNSLLDVLLQLGIFGLIFYLLLYLFVIYQFILLWRRPSTKYFAIFIGTALIAYSFSLLFGLADIVNVFYFWILAALGTAGNLIFKLGEKKTKLKYYVEKIFLQLKFKSRASVNSIFILGLSIILAVIAIFQAYMSISAIGVDHYFLSLNQYTLNHDYATANLLSEYIVTDSLNPVYLDNYQRSYSFFLVEALQQQPSLALSRYLEKSANEILLSLPLNSYDNIYSFAVLNCYLNGPDNSLNKFEQLINISPNKPNNFIALGDCLSSTNSDLALANYQHALTLLPKRDDDRLHGEQANYLDFYLHLIYYKIAELFYHSENYVEALVAYKQAYYLYPRQISILGDIATMYYYLGDYANAYNNLEHAYRRQVNVYWLDRLAALAYTINDQETYLNYWHLRQDISGQEFNYLDKDLIFP